MGGNADIIPIQKTPQLLHIGKTPYFPLKLLIIIVSSIFLVVGKYILLIMKINTKTMWKENIFNMTCPNNTVLAIFVPEGINMLKPFSNAWSI